MHGDAGGLPKSIFSLEYAFVSANADIHNPIVHVATEDLADKYCNLVIICE